MTRQRAAAEEMLESAECSNKGLASDLMKGFHLTGPIPPAGIAPPAWRPVKCSEAELQAWAPQSNLEVLRRARRPAALDPEVRDAFEQKAEEEVSAGAATSARWPCPRAPRRHVS